MFFSRVRTWPYLLSFFNSLEGSRRNKNNTLHRYYLMLCLIICLYQICISLFCICPVLCFDLLCTCLILCLSYSSFVFSCVSLSCVCTLLCLSYPIICFSILHLSNVCHMKHIAYLSCVCLILHMFCHSLVLSYTCLSLSLPSFFLFNITTQKFQVQLDDFMSDWPD